MTARMSGLPSALFVFPAVIAVITVIAAGGAAADTAKIRPHLRAAPTAKSECPPQPGGKRAAPRVRPEDAEGVNPQLEPPDKRSRTRRLRPDEKTALNLFSSGGAQPMIPGEMRGLDPQSEPRGEEGKAQPPAPGTKRGFKPQLKLPSGKSAPPPC